MKEQKIKQDNICIGKNIKEIRKQKKIKQIDKNRKDYHKVISNIEWGQKENYDISVNSLIHGANKSDIDLKHWSEK